MEWLPRATQKEWSEPGFKHGSQSCWFPQFPSCPSASSLFAPSHPSRCFPLAEGGGVRGGRCGGLCIAGGRGAAAQSLTSLVLSAPLQKSCTWHRGPPACPAPSARSIPWRSCAPIFGQGPMHTPVASRSTPSFSQQRALLQLPQSLTYWGNPLGWAKIGSAPLRKPLEAAVFTQSRGVPLGLKSQTKKSQTKRM